MQIREMKKRKYVTPWCEALAMDVSIFICGSVYPHKTESTIPEWDEDKENEEFYGDLNTETKFTNKVFILLLYVLSNILSLDCIEFTL